MIIDNIELFMVKPTADGNFQSYPLNLSQQTSNTLPSVIVKENEVISFKLFSKVQLPNLSLWIQDINLSARQEQNPNNLFEYTWSDPEHPLFLNHFGYCQIAIQLPGLDEQSPIFMFSLIEVLATKINADNADRILYYLEEKLDDIIRTCFSTTYQTAGLEAGRNRHPSFAIQQAVNILSQLLSLLPVFRARPYTRIRPQTQDETFTCEKFIGEKAINTILEQPDRLMPASPSEPNSFHALNKSFTSTTIKTEVLLNLTDVYENQVIHGFLRNIQYSLIDIKDSYKSLLASIDSDPEPTSIPIGYQHFGKIRKSFGRKYYQRIQLQCNEAILVCNLCQKYFRRYLPVSKIITTIPEMTFGFKAHPHYRSVFDDIVRWMKFGKHSISGDIYILSLKTLDKLFEFYGLFRLIDSFKALGFKIERTLLLSSASTDQTEDSNFPSNQYELINSNGQRIRLFYDTSIPLKASESLSGLISINSAPKKFRPDYVIEIQHSSRKLYAILDAKYTTRRLAFDRYLPELTMKYIHGINCPYGGMTPVFCLQILYPSPIHGGFDCESKSLHNKAFSISSRNCAIPALGIQAILSSDNSLEEKSLSKLLSSILETANRLNGELD